MATPEGKFKSDLRSVLVNVPYSWIHVADALMKKGFPDIVGSIRGRSFGVELKVDTKVSEIQKIVLKYMEHSGSLALIARKVFTEHGKKYGKYTINVCDTDERLLTIVPDETSLARYIESKCNAYTWIAPN
jgi:hypothetical protein